MGLQNFLFREITKNKLTQYQNNSGQNNTKNSFFKNKLLHKKLNKYNITKAVFKRLCCSFCLNIMTCSLE